MEIKVSTALLNMLNGSTTLNANLSVVITNGSRILREVPSKDFCQEDLNSMFALATGSGTTGNLNYTVSLIHTSEELNGTEIVCRLSLAVLEGLVGISRNNVSLRLFGPEIPKEGTLLIFEEVMAYPLLVTLSESPSYYKIIVDL
jgi:hypothetical protein